MVSVFAALPLISVLMVVVGVLVVVACVLVVVLDPQAHGPQMVVRLQRLSDYQVFLSVVNIGDCLSECDRIRENVGLLRCRITEVALSLCVLQIT